MQKPIVDKHVWMNRVQFSSEIEFIMCVIKCTKPYVSYKVIVGTIVTVERFTRVIV